MSTEKTLPARDRILAAAGRLFYAEGYRAVGIDRVIAEAGVAKATFYSHFPAKDDLIVAWLRAAEAGMQAALPPEDAPRPLGDYVAAVIAMAARPACLGCTWQGTAAEFADPGHPAHAEAVEAKRRVIAGLARRAEAEGLAEPEAVAERLFLLFEGLWAAVRMFGPEAPIGQAGEAARRLIGAPSA